MLKLTTKCETTITEQKMAKNKLSIKQIACK